MEELQTLLDNYSNSLDLLSKSIKMAENKIAQVKTDNTKKEVDVSISVLDGKIVNKVDAGDVKSIIEQNPNSVKIGFNKINNNIQFNESEMQINTLNGKGLTLKNGRLNTYDYSDGKVLGYIGQAYTEIGGTRYPGQVFGGGYNSYYTTFGLDGNYDNDTKPTGQGFEPFITLVYYKYNNLSRGIYFNQYTEFNTAPLMNGVNIRSASSGSWQTKLLSFSADGTLILGDDTYSKSTHTHNMSTMTGQVLKSTIGSLYLRSLSDRYGGLIVDGEAGHTMCESNGSHSLGKSSVRWFGAYFINNPSVSSDLRVKTNINYIDKTNRKTFLNITKEDLFNFVKDDLKLTTYNIKSEKEEEKTNTSIGFIAQDVAFTKVGSVLIQNQQDLLDGNEDNYLAYDTGTYVNILAGALQEEIKKREALEERLKALEDIFLNKQKEGL